MKNNYNTLHTYILDNSMSEYHKETVNGLFRSILEPVIANQQFEACIVFRLLDVEEKLSSIKRLSFSKSKIFSFSDSLNKYGYGNSELKNIWNTTEFVIIVGERYSACLIWDYSLSDKINYTPVCYLHNSNIIAEIAKKIADNSTCDLKDTLLKIMPDRRQNKLLNQAVNSLASILNEKNEEVLFYEIEKEHYIKSDDVAQTAAIVADKARFIAHEIKNNLSVINLYSAIFKKRLDNITTDDETLSSIKRAITNIENASESISYHISDLRCLSSPFKIEFNLKNSIESIISQTLKKAELASVNIIVDELPDMIVNADRVKFECAFLNVIYNAIEACSGGGEINISLLKEDNKIKVFIKNNGEKIPDDIRLKIFEPDFTTKESGNGLGLAICKKQLNLTGGNINLVYSNDEETLFEIVLIV